MEFIKFKDTVFIGRWVVRKSSVMNDPFKMLTTIGSGPGQGLRRYSNYWNSKDVRSMNEQYNDMLQKIVRKYGTAQKVDKIQAIIIGPPGSGKGTISERIVRDFKLDHLSSGDLLRTHIMNKTSFGQKIGPIVSSGGLVGTDLLAPLIEHELKESKSGTGWLLDGYPRTVDQAERLQKCHPPNTVIYLNVPFETIVDRIKARWVHVPSGRVYNLEFSPPKVPGKDDATGDDLVQREDDKPESVQKRLDQYQKSTDPVLQYYRSQKLLMEFKGTESNVIYPKVQEYLRTISK